MNRMKEAPLLIRLSLCKLAILVLLAPIWATSSCAANIEQGARVVRVASLEALQTAIDEAVPGTEIVLQNGTYEATKDLIIGCAGKSAQGQQILIRADKAGAAIITGKGGIKVVSPANYVTIEGFYFKNAASSTKMAPGTSHCRLTGNIFEMVGKGEYLTIAGNDQEIDHNNFQHKNSMGRMLAIRGASKQIAERLHIHHNYFYDFVDQGGANGAETLQFGLSGFSLSTSNSIVEYNLFEKCAGENELISVKASGVILRYNTIRDCKAQFTLRHGNKCQVYSNYFFNTPGLRIYGDDHLVFSNYFTNCPQAITIGNGDGEVADGAKLTSHDRPDRVLIAYNTLVDNKGNVQLQARKNGMGATNITVADNIIVGGNAAVSLLGSLKDPVWLHNLVYNTQSLGDLPQAGSLLVNPQLIKGANGIYQLTSASPAIGKGDPIKGVTVDLYGRPRAAKMDIGAETYSKEGPKAGPLTTSMVGVGAE